MDPELASTSTVLSPVAILPYGYVTLVAHLLRADGFGGGTNISNNLIYNQCRESGDHVSVKWPHNDSCTTMVWCWVSCFANCWRLAVDAVTGRDEQLVSDVPLFCALATMSLGAP